MDPKFVLILGAFLIVLAGIALGTRLLVPIIAQHFKGAAGGWGRLSELYATTRLLAKQVFRRQNVVVGRVLYRNCITIGFDDAGLYLERGFPMSILGKRTLFVPWTEIKRVEEGRLFWRKAAVPFARRTTYQHDHRADGIVQSCNSTRHCRNRHRAW